MVVLGSILPRRTMAVPGSTLLLLRMALLEAGSTLPRMVRAVLPHMARAVLRMARAVLLHMVVPDSILLPLRMAFPEAGSILPRTVQVVLPHMAPVALLHMVAHSMVPAIFCRTVPRDACVRGASLSLYR